MTKALLACSLAVLAATLATAQTPKPVSYNVAANYFCTDGLPNTGKTIQPITSEATFQLYYQPAASMGKGGRPSPIDFTRQFVIPIKEPASDIQTNINVKSLTKSGDTYTLEYTVAKGEKMTWTSKNCMAIIVNGICKKDIQVKRMLLPQAIDANNSSKPSSSVLTIDPIKENETSMSMGVLAFSKKDKKLYVYYDITKESGIVSINGVKHTLTKMLLKKGDIFWLTGSGVTITSSKFLADKSHGEDCFYGKVRSLTIKKGSLKAILNNMVVVNCPNY